MCTHQLWAPLGVGFLQEDLEIRQLVVTPVPLLTFSRRKQEDGVVHIRVFNGARTFRASDEPVTVWRAFQILVNFILLTTPRVGARVSPTLQN